MRLTAPTIALLGGLVVGCAASQQPISTELYVTTQSKTARQLEAQGRLAEARLHWRLAASVSPGNQTAATEIQRLEKIITKQKAVLLEKGKAALSKGRVRKAHIHFLKVLALDGTDKTALRELTNIERKRALARQGDKDEEALFAFMKRQTGGTPIITMKEFRAAAETALARSDYEGLLVSSEAVLNTRPRNHEALRYKYLACVSLADISRKSGRLIDAMRLFDTAERMGSNGANVSRERLDTIRTQLAAELDEEGQRLRNSNLDRSIELWTKALTYNSDLPQTRERLTLANRMRDHLRMITKPEK